MNRSYRYIDVERRGDVFCVRLRFPRLDEPQVYELANEVIALIAQDGCRKLAFSLGPGSPECLYSVFLAKLITIRRVLGEQGGKMFLCSVSPPVRTIFEACRLDTLFHFAPDCAAAVRLLSGLGGDKAAG